MKTIGLIGGMSWESTASYYKILNEETKRKCGGLHSAPIMMASVDFEEIAQHQKNGDWGKASEILADRAEKLQKAGADFLVLCTNTMHKVLPQVQSRVQIQFLHIAEATASRVMADGLSSIGLLGTRFTMEQDFYKDMLKQRGIDVLIPEEPDITRVHDIIYDELCRGDIRQASKTEYLSIISKLKDRGAQGIIAGCTEIGLLIQSDDLEMPLYDTAEIHAEEAVSLALS